MAKGILIAAMEFSDVAEDEFHDWYDTEHVPERLRVPGFINASRWIGIANPKQSVALYDLDNVGVLHSPPYQAVGGANGSPWTKRVTGRTKSLIRLEGEQILPGDALAGVPGVLRARRYRGSSAKQRYAAVYHFANPDVPSSAAWKAAANTPWTEKMRPHFRDYLRLDCRRYQRAQ